MLTLVLWIVVLAVVFAICHQGARTLATHHADAREAIATVMIGASVLAVVALVNSERLPGGSVALWMLAFAVSGGLYAGYERIDV